MKVNLTLKNDKIIGYTLYPLDNSKPIYDFTKDELNNIQLGYNSIKKGKIIKGKIPSSINIGQVYQEINELNNWFTWYDSQINLYNRNMRLYNKSNIDINRLDIEAIPKEKRITELKNLIKQC